MPLLRLAILPVLAALLVAGTHAGARAGNDADDVARAIFRQVERACPLGGGGQPYNLAAIVERHFLPELREMLDRAYRERRIDFDILIDAQDCEIRDVDIDLDGDDDAPRVVARAEFRNFGQPRVVDLLMVRTGRDWKVADVAYRHRNWSLRRELEHVGGK